jgi:hypothetical protein
VSRIVSAHPRVKLVQISWLASADGKATPVIKPSTSRVPPSVKSVAKQGDGNPGAPPQPAPGPAPGELAGGRFQTATIEAMVAAFDGDYRAALAEVDRFVAALNAIPGYEATLTESPLDTKPGASISARFGGRSDGTGEGRFVVRVSNAPGGRT